MQFVFSILTLANDSFCSPSPTRYPSPACQEMHLHEAEGAYEGESEPVSLVIQHIIKWEACQPCLCTPHVRVHPSYSPACAPLTHPSYSTVS